MPTYGTPAGATLTPAFLVNPETRVLLGTGGESDLDSTSWPAVVYDAPVGLASGLGLDLGWLADLNFRDVPTIEEVAGINYVENTVYAVTGEECEVTLTLQELKIGALAQAILTGHLYVLSEEGETHHALATFGGGCRLPRYPLVIEFTNSACDAPSTQHLGSGISGGILTLYSTVQTTGIDWSGIAAGVVLKMPITFKALPVTTRAKGNRLGSLYLY